PAIALDPFSAVSSVTTTSFGVIGGSGYAAGPLFEANLAPGAAGTLINPVFSGIENWLGFIGGCLVLLTLLAAPDGLVPANIRAARRVANMLRRAFGKTEPPQARTRTETGPQYLQEAAAGRERVPPRALEL